MGFFERLKEGLSKTRRNFTDRIQELVGLSAAIDDDFLDELEMILLSADVGVKTTEKLIVFIVIIHRRSAQSSEEERNQRYRGCYTFPEKIYGRNAGRQRPTYTYRCQADGYSCCWR